MNESRSETLRPLLDILNQSAIDDAFGSFFRVLQGRFPASQSTANASDNTTVDSAVDHADPLANRTDAQQAATVAAVTTANNCTSGTGSSRTIKPATKPLPRHS